MQIKIVWLFHKFEQSCIHQWIFWSRKLGQKMFRFGMSKWFIVKLLSNDRNKERKNRLFLDINRCTILRKFTQLMCYWEWYFRKIYSTTIFGYSEAFPKIFYCHHNNSTKTFNGARFYDSRTIVAALSPSQPKHQIKCWFQANRWSSATQSMDFQVVNTINVWLSRK